MTAPGADQPGELLKEDRELFFGLSQSLFAVVDDKGVLLRLSTSWEQLLGFPRSELVGRRFTELMHPDDVERTLAFRRLAAVSTEQLPPIENRYLCADGRTVWLRWATETARDGSVTWCIARDVTASRARVAQQEVVADLGRHALEGGTLAELLEGGVRGLSRSLMLPIAVVMELLPNGTLRPAAALGVPYDPADPIVLDVDERTLAGRAVLSGKVVTHLDVQAEPDAHWRQQEYGAHGAFAVPIGRSERPWGVLAGADTVPRVFDDIELRFVEQVAHVLGAAISRRQVEEDLQHQATHDSLTGLPNRQLLRDRVDAALRESRRTGGAVGLLLCDLDGFKDVNDSLGHAAGDTVLQQLAERLLAAVGEGGTVARLGGDEFAMCVVGPATELEVLGVADAVVTAVREPFSLAAQTISLSTSVGVSVSPAHGRDASTLLRHADVAMYRAKARRTGWALYDSVLDTGRGDRLGLMSELRTAVADGALALHYQPIVDLGSGQLCGVEALCRWHQPGRGDVPPTTFIPLAEQSGLIVPLTTWVVAEAARQVALWREQGHEVPCAVNLSMAAVNTVSGSTALLAQLVEAAPWITVEITESWLADARGKEVVHELAAAGVKLALDDFGTGWSSLASLRAFPVHRLKLDRQFLVELDDDKRGPDLLSAVCDLASALDMEIVAEGVEHESVLTMLRAAGIGLGQGFLWSRALPPDELARWGGWDPGQPVPAKHRA